MFNMLGQNILKNNSNNNQPVFYLYDDGTVKKRIVIEWKKLFV